MKLFRSLRWSFIAVLFASSFAHAQYQQPADLILHNGKIITVDDHGFTSRLGTIAQAMHVRDGKVLHVSNNADIRAMAGPNSKVIDLKGRTVIPGIILTHEHPYDWGSVHTPAFKKYITDDQVVIRVLEGSPQENARAMPGVVQEAVAKAKPGQWIYIVVTSGKNFEYHSFSNGGLGRQLLDPSVRTPQEMQIPYEKLDEWAPNNPLVVHSWLAETPMASRGQGASGGGLNKLGMEEALKVLPEGPAFQSEEISGRSIFSEIVMKDFYPQLVQIMKSSMVWWAGYGMTTYASHLYTPSNMRVYRDLDRKGEMPIRNMWTFRWNSEYVFADLFFLTDMATRLGEGSDYFWNGGAAFRTLAGGGDCTSAQPVPSSKIMQDERFAAQMRERQTRNCRFAPGTPDYDLVYKFVRAGGRFVNLHVTGDGAVDGVLNAIERATKDAGMTEEEIRAKRYGVDHTVLWPRPEQMPTMKRLGFIASSDGAEITYASPSVFDLYGERVASWVVPSKSFIQAGINNSLEVDRPIQTTTNVTIFSGAIDPIITRRAWDGKVYAQNEAVDRETALKIATYYGSYYVMKEDKIGSLEPGKLADFLILDRDYLTIPVDQIKDTRVLMTVVGGRVIHLVPSLAKEFGLQPSGEQVNLGGPAAQW